MDAEEAERSGLVSRIVPAKKLMEDVMATATKDCRKINADNDGRERKR